MTAWGRTIVALALVLILAGCTGPPPTQSGDVLTLTRHAYRYDGEAFIQTDGDPDDAALLGVVCDLHGNSSNARTFASRFAAAKVDAVLVCGDMCDYFRDPGPDDVEMERVLRPFLTIGVPVLVIPGNHEGRAVYSPLMERLGHDHPALVDMVRFPTARLDDIAVVAIGGYHAPRFLAPEGFLFTETDYESAVRRGQEVEGPRLLFTHGPPLSSPEGGIDQIEDGTHVGDPHLNEVFADGGFAVHVFGHIHEAGGRAETPDGSPVVPDSLVEHLLVNAAPGSPWPLLDGTTTAGQAAFVRIGNGTASYNMIAAS